MAHIIDLKTFTDKRGNLTVIEKVIPFDIKRVFYIYGVDDSTRGLHRHQKTIQAAISIQGSCEIWNQSSEFSCNEKFLLDHPSKCLIINPEDYHWMKNFSEDCILMVLASEYFDAADYIYDSYNRNI
jgi:dTDP-4-dehydrorhamnose 3,5-epimerase-like enzyme